MGGGRDGSACAWGAGARVGGGARWFPPRPTARPPAPRPAAHPPHPPPGVILLAPSSRDASTWDMFGNGYGPDVAYVNNSLAQVADLYNVDRARVGLQGFSDGATYALSLGLANGKVFTHVIALSPGGLAPPSLSGNPAVFISSGTNDSLFPKAQAADQIVCQLLENQYDVT